MEKKHASQLSPFEFKDELIKKAKSNSDKIMLNAGRGNPNFLALLPRYAFLRLNDFALKEAERGYSYLHSGLGATPEKNGIVERFDCYAAIHRQAEGVDFLNSALSFVYDHMGISKADFLYEVTEAILGCNYPIPPRMLNYCEKVVKAYLSQELCNTTTRSESFNLFATEGGTAAMTYLFQTLKANALIKPKDKIAIITPIFSPYLEIPEIPAYNLEITHIHADENQHWQIPAKELKKLEDPAIKLLCLVNPSNPPSVKISDDTLNQIQKIIQEKRPDLMIITDDVYATFSDNFTSLFSKCAHNTLCVYSFSKYFGATGWRLGTIALHEDNLFDKLLQTLPEKEKLRLDQRYASLTPEPRNVRFIDRVVADSRTVALNHTAGLSNPQQVQMTLFAISCLIDEEQMYKKSAKHLIRRRYNILYQAMGIVPDSNENSVDYYTLINLESLGEKSIRKAICHLVYESEYGS
ncbi:bifunctional aspartate transaminase/aspartate 4-decarboxylase [Piscirickettsia litoralis]|uniref:bifunctional aspartate transaminase/aspartate 4-decarboxylase n=1 Tax=Piscirickettsia litoralis TaxID=1891921 RepID=UPI000AB17CAB|nr:bifunctional aspartate transaminase/aspartate 4-decarboxylase [Piscirickettsia litoralis]